MAAGLIRVGTSGWCYKDWARAFYPAEVRVKDQLTYYATQFSTVEINATFYRLAPLSAVENWTRSVPSDFKFAIKGSRFLTHMKKLRDPGPGQARFFESIRGFRQKAGPILWQLPAILRKDAERLESFCRKLPRRHRHAFEFRHPSWLCDEIFAILRRHRIALVWLSSQNMPMDCTATADFVYVRFHGLAGGAAHDYTEAELKPWARELRRRARSGCPAFAYFNNDVNANAPENARTLIRLAGAMAVHASS